MEFKKIDLEKMDKALELTWKTFLEYEAPDYSQEGIDEFKKTIDDEQWLSAREFYGAYEADELLGLIATKDKSHIALFFVDGKHHRKGIGRKLFGKVLEENDKNYFTVNSSPEATSSGAVTTSLIGVEDCFFVQTAVYVTWSVTVSATSGVQPSKI